MQLFKENILDRFISVVNQHENNIAFVIQEKEYSYVQLKKYIISIQNEIIKLDSEGDLFCLVCNDDIYTYASIWALWFLGKAYVPLHPEQPLDRNENIIKQVDASIVLDSSSDSIYKNVHVICTSIFDDVYLSNDKIVYNQTDDTSTAYILFTSGSTGTPKGVEISRKNVEHFVKGMEQCGYVINEDDKCLQYFDLTFDVSMQSYLLPLLNGASVFTIPVGALRAAYAIQLIQNHKLTCASIAPSLIRLFRSYLKEIDAKSLRLCIVTAEASYKSLLQGWGECASNAVIFDFYGPTECTVYCTFYRCPTNLNDIKHHNDCLTIGKVMPGLIGVIIDENNNILPRGEKGELCIAGPQLSTGYWKNEEKNSEAFFNLMYDGIETRFYHTGDLCYEDTDGDIMYLGRIDFQAKIQGYRVELGEIEYHIKTYLKKDAVVLAVKTSSGDDQLYAFIKSTVSLDREALVSYLKSKMPLYMLPVDYKIMQEFPLNANGKIDRKQLIKLI